MGPIRRTSMITVLLVTLQTVTVFAAEDDTSDNAAPNAPQRLAFLKDQATFGGGTSIPGLRPIGHVKADISVDSGRMPIQSVLPQTNRYTRNGVGTTFQWKPTQMAHPPLLFEEYNLERHGHAFGDLQPAFSALHFFGSVPLIPYHCVAANGCDYELGHTRPGSCSPFIIQKPQLKTKPTLVQAAAITASLLLVP